MRLSGNLDIPQNSTLSGDLLIQNNTQQNWYHLYQRSIYPLFSFSALKQSLKTLCELELLNHNNVKIISAPWEHSNVHTSLFTADTQWTAINFGETLQCKMKQFPFFSSQIDVFGFFGIKNTNTTAPLWCQTFNVKNNSVIFFTFFAFSWKSCKNIIVIENFVKICHPWHNWHLRREVSVLEELVLR